MASEDELFFKKLLSIFYTEASEHLQNMTTELIELENITSEDEKNTKIGTIYRAAHSLKGAAISVEAKEIGMLCQALESLLSRIQKQPQFLSKALFNLLHQTIDRLTEVKDTMLEGEPVQRKKEDFQLIQQMEQFDLSSQELLSTPSPPPLPPTLAPIEQVPETSISPLSEKQTQNISPLKHQEQPQEKIPDIPPPLFEPKNVTEHFSPKKQIEIRPPKEKTNVKLVKIPAKRLDKLLLEAEEMLSIKLSEAQKIEDLQELSHLFSLWEKEWAKFYPYFRKLQQSESSFQEESRSKEIQRLTEFLDWNQTHLKLFGNQLKNLRQFSLQSYLNTSSMIENLLKNTKEVLMLPFSEILEGVPKIVRDLALKQKKQIRFVFQGSDIEIDKRILDELKDPLTHLVRNSIDHGIEEPSERIRQHKKEEGQISISINQLASNKVEIIFSDDGRGISTDNLKATAIQAGFFTEEELKNFSTQQLMELVFISTISTSKQVTEISGRGLGLSIVHEKIEQLGGTITIESTLHQQTIFRMFLPLTLSTFRGVLIKTANQIFVVPTIHIVRVLKCSLSEIKTVENQLMIEQEEKAIPLVWLHEVLELPPTPKSKQTQLFILVLKSSPHLIAFIVDEILYEQEVLIKSLGKQLVRVRNVSGGTILGSGEIAFILNVSDLVQSCIRKQSQRASRFQDSENQEPKTVLVVEDSITARMLLKNMLELAGYIVDIAVDGLEAFSKIETNPFDVIVTDIEMPRMNGLNLCAKIRSDTRFSHLPVILVSSLESEEDRKRGLEVGADAYLVKSSFEQSNLLETIQRLL